MRSTQKLGVLCSPGHISILGITSPSDSFVCRHHVPIRNHVPVIVPVNSNTPSPVVGSSTRLIMLSSVRAEIKAWERNFKDEHGTHPSVQDIKQQPEIGIHIIMVIIVLHSH